MVGALWRQWLEVTHAACVARGAEPLNLHGARSKQINDSALLAAGHGPDNHLIPRTSAFGRRVPPTARRASCTAPSSTLTRPSPRATQTHLLPKGGYRAVWTL